MERSIYKKPKTQPESEPAKQLTLEEQKVLGQETVVRLFTPITSEVFSEPGTERTKNNPSFRNLSEVFA